MDLMSVRGDSCTLYMNYWAIYTFTSSAMHVCLKYYKHK